MTPVLTKIESSDRSLHAHKDNSKQNKCGKSLYAGGNGSFPKVADDEMKSSLEIRLFRHDPFEGCAGIRVLAHLDKEDPDVVHYFDPHAL